MNRRTFLKTSVAFPYVARSTVLGANDRVQVGFIGVGNRARWLLEHEDFGEAQVSAIADISPWSLAEAMRLQPKGQTWRPYNDYRRMFDQEKLDAVFVETTTHARVLVCLHVLQAGMDVYAEKPLTLTVEEGQVLTRAVRKLGRVLQVGTQQRSMPINIYASKLVSEGKIGKIEKVIVCNFIGPEKWTPQQEQPKPAGLDWDMWCNQTELRPYHPKLHHEWATWWDYDGGGQSWGVSGWGTHSLDQVQAALGTSLTGPVEIRLESPGPEGKITLVYASGTRVCLEQPKIDDHQQLGGIFEGTNGENPDSSWRLQDEPPRTQAGRAGRNRRRSGRECVPHPKLRRSHQDPLETERGCRDCPPLDDGLSPHQYLPRTAAKLAMGSGGRAFCGRRRGKRQAGAEAPQGLRTA
jgi:predicted dehydrogenase